MRGLWPSSLFITEEKPRKRDAIRTAAAPPSHRRASAGFRQRGPFHGCGDPRHGIHATDEPLGHASAIDGRDTDVVFMQHGEFRVLFPGPG